MSLLRKKGSLKRHKYNFKDVKYLRDTWQKNLKNLSLCRDMVVGKNDSYDIEKIKNIVRELNIMVRAGAKNKVDEDEIDHLNSGLFEAQVVRGGRGPLHSDRAQRRSIEINPDYAAKITIRDLIAINRRDIEVLGVVVRNLEPDWGKIMTLKIIGGNMSFIDGDIVDVIETIDFSITKFHKDFSVICRNDVKVQKIRGFMKKKSAKFKLRVVQETEITSSARRSTTNKTTRKRKRNDSRKSFDSSDESDYSDSDDEEDDIILALLKQNPIAKCLCARYGPHLFRVTDVFLGYCLGITLTISFLVVSAALVGPYFFFPQQDWMFAYATAGSAFFVCLFMCVCWGLCSGARSGFLGGYLGCGYNLTFFCLFLALMILEGGFYFAAWYFLDAKYVPIHILYFVAMGMNGCCMITCFLCSLTKLIRIPFTNYPTERGGVIRVGYERIN